MVVLKKTKASTLMETLVATVIIVIVFMLASMLLNNLFSNTINSNTQTIKNHLNELEYLQQHNQLELPYTQTYKGWSITLETVKENNTRKVLFEAQHTKTKKTLRFSRNESP